MPKKKSKVKTRSFSAEELNSILYYDNSIGNIVFDEIVAQYRWSVLRVMVFHTADDKKFYRTTYEVAIKGAAGFQENDALFDNDAINCQEIKERIVKTWEAVLNEQPKLQPMQ